LSEKPGKAGKPPQVYGRYSEGTEGFPEGTQKEKGREGKGKGDVILLVGAKVERKKWTHTGKRVTKKGCAAV
jgi:hypothetical protein